MLQSSTANSTPRLNRNDSSIRPTLAAVIPGAGLGLALLLTWNSWTSSGCLIGGCSHVLNSPYSHLAGVPVGLFASALWLALLLISQGNIQGILRAILALGGLFFLMVQLFLLDGFCFLCALHSGLTGLALLPPRKRPTAGQGLASLATSVAVLFVLAEPSDAESPPPTAVPPHQLDENPALYWLGSQADESPWMILSFTCGHCWTKLDELTRLDPDDFEYGPGLIFLTNVRNRFLTQHILAAALSSGERPARMLEWLAKRHGEARWQILRGNSGLLLPALEEAYPRYKEFVPQANRILEAHLDFIEKTQVPMTPFLLTRNARKAEFTLEETFGPAQP